METVTASRLRSHIFEYLGKVKQGETISVVLNKKETARLVPVQHGDWWGGLRGDLKVKCPTAELLAPLDDVWEDYV